MADKPSPPIRPAAQIEAEMNAARERLTTSLESLIDQVHPNRIKQRGILRLKAVGFEYVEKAKGLVFNARGDLRTNRVAAVGGGLAGFIAFIAVVRRIRGRKSA